MGLASKVLPQFVLQDHAEIFAERCFEEKVELALNFENKSSAVQMIKGIRPF